MKYKKTKHGAERMQQRGKRDMDVRVIQKYGERQRQGGVCLLTRRRAQKTILRLKRWVFKKQNSPLFTQRVIKVKKIVESIERTIGCMAIFINDSYNNEVLLTIYHADKKRQHKFMRGKCRAVPSYSHGEK